MREACERNFSMFQGNKSTRKGLNNSNRHFRIIFADCVNTFLPSNILLKTKHDSELNNAYTPMELRKRKYFA